MAHELHEAGRDWWPGMEADATEDRHRSRGAQRHVNEYLSERGRLDEFFKAHDIHILDAQRPAFMESTGGRV